MNRIVKQLDEARTVILPRTILIVRENTFCNLKSLRSVILNEGAREIESSAFADCSLRRIVFPSTLSKIEPRVFQGTRDMKIVHVADGCDVDIMQHVYAATVVLPLELTQGNTLLR